MRQEVARAHKGWALDSVTVQNVVLKQMKEEITAPPTVSIHWAHLLLSHSLVGFPTILSKLANCPIHWNRDVLHIWLWRIGLVLLLFGQPIDMDDYKMYKNEGHYCGNELPIGIDASV